MDPNCTQFLKLRRNDSDVQVYMPVSRIQRVFHDRKGDHTPEWHTVFFDLTGLESKAECKHFRYFETADEASAFYQMLSQTYGFTEVIEKATGITYLVPQANIKAFYYEPNVKVSARSHTVFIDLNGTSDVTNTNYYGCCHVKYFPTSTLAAQWCEARSS